MVFKRGGGVDVIPLLGLMAMGAQRLLPALQQIYTVGSVEGVHSKSGCPSHA